MGLCSELGKFIIAFGLCCTGTLLLIDKYSITQFDISLRQAPVNIPDEFYSYVRYGVAALYLFSTFSLICQCGCIQFINILGVILMTVLKYRLYTTKAIFDNSFDVLKALSIIGGLIFLASTQCGTCKKAKE